MISPVFVVLALAAVSPVLAGLGKKTLFPNGLHDPLIGLDNIPVPKFTTKSVAVPDICTSHAHDAKCDTTKVEAYQVTYGDCSEPWTLCRCSDAQMDIQRMATRFGQIPSGVRSYVGSALAVKANSCSAGSSGDFIVFNGDCSQSVFDHESGHSLDKGTSISSTWTNALKDSTCVPDDYANTSVQEDFAQVNVCYIYQARVGNLPADPSCMQAQLNVFSNDARIHGAITSAKCNAGVRPFQLSDSEVSSKDLSNAVYNGKISTTFFHPNS